MRFTSSTTRHIEISIRRDHDDPRSPPLLDSSDLSGISVKPEVRLKVVVRDNGIGLSAMQRDSAFSPFFQADNSLSRLHIGTGMGLSICRLVVELLGGKMTAESDGKDKGTTITYTIRAELPTVAEISSSSDLLPPPPVEEQMSPSPSPPTSPLLSSLSLSLSEIFFPYNSPQHVSLPKQELEPLDKNMRILLVEDNQMNQKILLRLFNKLGTSPDLASHGDEAVELVKKQHYHIVFMDLHMPVCDGFEATRKILELPDPFHKPPIFALTASVSAEDKAKCIALGMKGHLPKPVSLKALLEVLSSALPNEM